VPIVPAVHGGFLSRSRSVPIESLFRLARQRRQRFVLCGHSLGGAVAVLCLLRLLAVLPELPPPVELRCIGFGMPALGNTALVEHVKAMGWEPYFLNVFLPGMSQSMRNDVLHTGQSIHIYLNVDVL
jgi:predicted lipase